MQKWPYADFGYINVEHYAQEYKRQRSELNEYLEKLGADGWKLTTSGIYDGKRYQFRRYHFRRTIE